MKIIIDTTSEYTTKALKMFKVQIREYFWSNHKLSNLLVTIDIKIRKCENCSYFQENLVCEGGMCNLLGIEIRHSAILSCEKHRGLNNG